MSFRFSYGSTKSIYVCLHAALHLLLLLLLLSTVCSKLRLQPLDVSDGSARNEIMRSSRFDNEGLYAPLLALLERCF